MAEDVASLKVKFMSEGEDKVGQDVDTLGKKIENTGKSSVKTGTMMTAGLTTPILAMGVSMFNAASDTEEAQQKVNTVFGDSSAEINKWADSSTTALGMTRAEALAAAGTFGNLFTGMGMSQSAAGDMSMEMIQLAVDMASFNNVPVSEALAAIQSGLVGEAEPLRRFGVLISDAEVKNKALEMGLVGVGEELTEQQKVLARQALIMEQSGNATGDFERNNSAAANSLKIAAAEFGNMKASIGALFLPMVTKAIHGVTKFIRGINNLSTGTKKLIVIIAGIAAAIGPLLLGFGMTVKVLGNVATAIKGVMTAISLLASPIGLIIIAVAALAAGAIYLYKHWEPFRNTVNNVAKALRAFIVGPALAFIRNLGTQIKDAWTATANFVDSFTSWSDAFDKIGGKIKEFGNWLKDIDWAGALDGLRDSIAGVDWQGMWNTISSAASTAWDAISGINWGGILQSAWSGLSGAAGWITDAIGSAVDALAGWFSDQFGGVDWIGIAINAVAAMGQAVGDAIGAGVSLATDLFNWLAGQLDSVDWGGLGGKLADLLMAGIAGIAGLVGMAGWFLWNIGVALADVDWPALGKSIVNFLGAAVMGVGEFLLGFGGKLWAELQSIFKAINWGQLWEALKQAATAAWNLLKDYASSGWDKVKQFFSGVDWGAIWNSMKMAAKLAWGTIKEVAKTAWENAKEAVREIDWSGVWDKVKEIAEGIFDGIADYITDKLAGVLSGIIDVYNAIPVLPDIDNPYKEVTIGAAAAELASDKLKDAVDRVLGSIRARDQQQQQDTGVDDTGAPIPVAAPEAIPANFMSSLSLKPVQDFAAELGKASSAATNWQTVTSTSALGVGLGVQKASNTTKSAGDAIRSTLSNMASQAVADSGRASTGVTGNFVQLRSNAAGEVATLRSTAGLTFTGITATANTESARTNAQFSANMTSMQLAVAGKITGMRTNTAISMALMANDATTQGQKVSRNMGAGIAANAGKVIGAMASLTVSIALSGASAATTAYNIGANISSSFAKGMLAYLSLIRSAASSMVTAASQALMAKAMIASPSKLFRGHGKDTGAGYVLGVEDMIPAAQDAAAALVEASSASVNGDALIPSYAGGMSSAGAIIDNRAEYFITLSDEQMVSLLAARDKADALYSMMTDKNSAKQYRKVGS